LIPHPRFHNATIPLSTGLRQDENWMKRRLSIVLIATVVVLSGIAFYAALHWAGGENSARESALAAMPSDARSVLYADVAALRQTPFIAGLRDWAPTPQLVDPEYAQFLRDTGFDYERDLDRITVALIGRAPGTTYLVVADGRFDRKRINTYTSQFGTHESRGGREIFTVPVSGSPRKISFTFPRQNRIALTDNADLPALLAQPRKGEDEKQWRARYDRLAGSPLFAVVRQDAESSQALTQHTPGGLQSPQLAMLLGQLLWVTLGAKPEGDRLRFVIEGESPTEAVARELFDFLGGALILAQAGLNGPRVREQMAPQAREAYLEILKGADISRLDRGDTKSVRVVLDITPKFLAAARSAVPVPREPQPPHK
jgi:hypothetical protein